MSTCPACQSLSIVGIQCNTHRRTAPNARTLKGRQIIATMNATGMTAAEAEAFHGTTQGVAIR